MKRRVFWVLVFCLALLPRTNAQTPAITSQPQSITVNNASTATFTVVATNAAAYQWQFQSNSIAGATNSTLTCDDVTTNQAGYYTVVVTSSGGSSVTSQPPALLTITNGTVVLFRFSGYPGGASSNVTVQLFDYDKPVTVSNFLQYINPLTLVAGNGANLVQTNAAFANMIWERCIPGFVLQGGSYDATDRTNNVPPPSLESIAQVYTANTNYQPPFAQAITNEFNVGPLIPNEFGTIAMALQSGNPNSASGAFFFNLTNNASYLDTNNGGFTVFGRILSGSNVLQYFNTLTNQIYDLSEEEAYPGLGDVPSDVQSTNSPADSNLFFVDFNPPSVVMNYPTNGQTVTNFDVVLYGTATGSNALWRVVCAYSNSSQSALFAAGATNWSLGLGTLAPGTYTTSIFAQDVAGSVSSQVTNFFVVPVFSPVILSQPQSITINNASTAAFTVVAANTASYQWQFQGASIAGATNSTLTYDDVTANQAGAYTVVVTSVGGSSVTSQPPALLTIANGTVVQFLFSGFLGGGSSNVTVQLFDHDKPVTVSNFLQYIVPLTLVASNGAVPVQTNAAFANMIWDRCIPGFVLQGGSYDATDRTNYIPPPSLQSVNQNYTSNSSYQPPFAQAITNEFNVGPLIHNEFGTIAMAKLPGDPNSASCAFFFNLADNSTNLDNQNGGFTVFGRILSGSNVLQYFNTLSKPNRGIFDSTTLGINSPFTDLPVNDDSYNVPANANLCFVDFNPPSVTMNYPANGQTVTNADVVFYGTATGSNALARVVCVFDNQFIIPATGTTNWSLDFGLLPPGTYTSSIVAQDAAGSLSSQLTSSFVVPFFPYKTIVKGNGNVSSNWNGVNTIIGSNYTVKATPGKGAVFVNWSSGANAWLNPTETFIMENGLQLTATFISNTMPGGISFTHPAANAQVTNSTFTISGKVAASVEPVQVTCQVFSATASNSVTAPMTTNASSQWSTPPISLGPGAYVVQAVAANAHGRATVISRKFTVNFYPRIAGRYHGIFLNDTNVSPTNAGYFSFVLGDSGVVDGNLVFPLGTLAIRWPMGPTGSVTLPSDKGIDGSIVTLDMNFDLTTFSGVMTGYVSNGVIAPLTAYRADTHLSAATAPSPGKYVLSLQPESGTNAPLHLSNAPPGDSFAAINVSAGGNLSVIGALADNTAFSQSTGVFTNGAWPLYASFYHGYGMLIGWMTNLPSGEIIGSNVFWVKSPTNGVYYTNGLGVTFNSAGASFLRPAAGGQYKIIFDSGTIATPLTNSLTVNAGQFVPAGGSPDNLSIRLSSAGVLTGSILNPTDNKTLKFKGVFLGPSQGGSGFILDTDGQTGSFQLGLLP